jgi:hypothetical protein
MCDRYYFRAAPVINQNIALNDGHFILATRVVVANHRLMTHTLNFIKIFFHHSFIQYYFHEVRGQNIRFYKIHQLKYKLNSQIKQQNVFSQNIFHGHITGANIEVEIKKNCWSLPEV